MTVSDPNQSRLRRVLGLVALGYAFVVILARLGAPLPWQVVQSDSSEYIRLASNLAVHGVFGYEASAASLNSSNIATRVTRDQQAPVQGAQVEPSARRELLYPLFLAGFMKLGLVTPFDEAPRNFWPVLLVQAGLYVAALWMLAERARCLVPEAVVRTSVVLGAAYFPVAKCAFQILSEGLTIVLVSAFFFALHRSGRTRLMLAAVLLGLLALIKSVMLPLAPLVAGFLLRARGITKRLALSFTVIALAFPAAWVARNYARLDRFVPSTTDGASSLYRGNMVLGYQAPGWSDPAIPVEVRRERERLGLAADPYLVRLTRHRMLESPGKFALQLLFKLGVLWVGEPRSSDGFPMFAVRCLMAALIASRISLFLRSRDPDAHLVLLFAAYQSLIYTLLLTVPRYFVPATFLLLPLAASALHGLHSAAQARLSRRAFSG